HYDIFALADSVLAGDNNRIGKILHGLKQDSTESLLVLWALTREVRSLCGIAFACTKGQTLEQVLMAQSVWESRKPLVNKAISRYSYSQWQDLLVRASQIDCIIKGALPGD